MVDLIPEPVPEMDETAAASGAFAAGAKRVKGAVIRPESTHYEIPKVTDDASYADVRPGTRYIDPTGDTVVKPWQVQSESDYDRVPEGQFYLDPSGEYIQKPVFEPLNFTQQALYDMASSASKKKVLEKYYPGKVKEDSKGLYVDEGNGKLKRPGVRDVGSFAGKVGGEFFPVAGSTGGGIVGGVFGNLPGAIGGAAAGGVAGQGINDLVLALAGIYPESAGQEALRLAGAGVMGAAGEGAGRALGAVVPTIREGISKATEKGVPWALNKALVGAATTTEDLVLGEKLTARGYPAPPSMVMKGAPRLQNAVERFRERYNLGAMRSELEPYYEEEFY